VTGIRAPSPWTTVAVAVPVARPRAQVFVRETRFDPPRPVPSFDRHLGDEHVDPRRLLAERPVAGVRRLERDHVPLDRRPVPCRRRLGELARLDVVVERVDGPLLDGLTLPRSRARRRAGRGFRRTRPVAVTDRGGTSRERDGESQEGGQRDLSPDAIHDRRCSDRW
jgi:hypothetical protein